MAEAEAAAAMLSQLVEKVRQLGPYFSDARCVLGLEPADGSSPPLTATWLASASYFVENVGSWLCTLVQVGA